jgi:hypothetical protein
MLEIINQKSFHIEELSALQFGWQIDFTQLGPAKLESAVSLVQSANLGVCHFQFNSRFDQRLHAQPVPMDFGIWASWLPTIARSMTNYHRTH